MKRVTIAFTVLMFAILACREGNLIPLTPRNSVFDSGRTAYGFYPSPPEVSLISVLKLHKDMSAHADFGLLQ